MEVRTAILGTPRHRTIIALFAFWLLMPRTPLNAVPLPGTAFTTFGTTMVSVRLTHVTRHAGEEYDTVSGVVRFEDSQRAIEAVDLSCLTLRIGNVSKRGVWLDTFADVMPDGLDVASRKGQFDVYWSFPRNTQISADMPISLSVQPGPSWFGGGSPLACVHYRDATAGAVRLPG